MTSSVLGLHVRRKYLLSQPVYNILFAWNPGNGKHCVITYYKSFWNYRFSYLVCLCRHLSKQNGILYRALSIYNWTGVETIEKWYGCCCINLSYKHIQLETFFVLLKKMFAQRMFNAFSIRQLYREGQFYLWRKSDYPEEIVELNAWLTQIKINRVHLVIDGDGINDFIDNRNLWHSKILIKVLYYHCHFRSSKITYVFETYKCNMSRNENCHCNHAKWF